MIKSIGSNPALVGILIIGFGFFALFIAPIVTTQKHFSFPVAVDSQKNEPSSLALDASMRVLRGQSALKKFQINKTKVTLRELINGAGKPVLLNFWATWCPPCIEEFPSVEYLNRQLLKEGVKLPFLVTVTVDESERDVAKFYNTLDFEPSLVVLHDIDGNVSRAFGTVKFPETYLVSREGKTLHKWAGPQNWLSRDVIQDLAALQNP